ncbi:Hsp20/alpha crystallin family protein [Sutcliffiella halmapala]|uniref:Hsp20/alpha crystallin family protein n=1 Tax=Sutcliffiella halmapala TaxID=79882 RepID=UPI00099562ED|nr:Hsp20/alpha crystallin family protein [Sutcliffiella halmapala]
MKKNQKNMNPWENMNEKIDDVLGEKFWKEVLPVIPRRVPLVDIYETATEGVILLELPGLRSTDDVQISVQNNQLIIKGTIPYPYPVAKEKLQQSERFFGSFQRAIQIPFSFVPQKLVAQYKQGILFLTFQKAKQDFSVEIDFHDS